MQGSITNWTRQQKRKFRRRAAKIKDADHHRRYDIVLHAAEGRSHRQIAENLDGRIVLHFLPSYCPNDNRIERSVWREVHANITRNHCCETIEELVREVCRELAARNRRNARRQANVARALSESCEAI